MRIAFVTAYPPSPLRVRAYSFVRELARDHAVTVATLCHGDEEVAAAQALRRNGVQIVAVREPSWAAEARAAKALLRGTSLQVAHGGSAALRRAVDRLVETGSVDVVHVEHLRAIEAVRHVQMPVVWDAVDCISDLYALGARYHATPMMRVLGHLESRRACHEEQQQLTRLSHIVVTTSRERAALQGNGQRLRSLGRHRLGATGTCSTQAAIHVVPNGVDPDYFVPPAMPRAGNVVVFSGRMCFHANVAAASKLTVEVMPLVWESRPDVKLVLVGSRPPRQIRLLGSDRRVMVTGYVPDLRPYIGRATVAVSPTPYAVGVQNKVLEALALGTPVVATPSSVAGLQTVAGRDLLVASTTRDIADAILRLLDDAMLRERLAQNGRRYVVQQHNWHTATQALLQVYKRSLIRSSHL